MDLSKIRQPVQLTDDIITGKERMLLIAGPCAIENLDICLQTAGHLKDLSANLGIDFVFKASFDKANRTSGKSFRSVGLDRSLSILGEVKKQLGVPLITDVHESNQVSDIAAVVDIIQIPAFLCRQTDLLEAAGISGKAVNIKKGQFMAPEDMEYAVDKIRNSGNQAVLLTERGCSFGYHNLVVDFRSIPIMRTFAPVIFDVTHSVQQPGGLGGSSGGQREFAAYLARAAAATGVDGFFIETHPDPASALSDGPNMIPLQEMGDFLKMIMKYWTITT